MWQREKSVKTWTIDEKWWFALNIIWKAEEWNVKIKIGSWEPNLRLTSPFSETFFSFGPWPSLSQWWQLFGRQWVCAVGRMVEEWDKLNPECCINCLEGWNLEESLTDVKHNQDIKNRDLGFSLWDQIPSQLVTNYGMLDIASWFLTQKW
jgi:hypothetical protein